MENILQVLRLQIYLHTDYGFLLITTEFFISYDDFHGSKNKQVSSITNVEEHAPGYYYWPDIDVDLSQEIIEHPERFPLSAKIT